MTVYSVDSGGERRAATINDVARTAGVSRAAVSKVIRNAYGVSPAMRQRVEGAIVELGYRPRMAARALRGSSYRLGLEIPHLHARFVTQIVEGAKEALRGTPYQLLLAPAEGPEYDTIEALADGLVDGMIAVSPLVDTAWLEDQALRIPIVMLGRHDQPVHYDTVVGDDVLGARQVMDHLFGLGHRRIAHITESEAVTIPGSGTPHSMRLETYLACMAEAGFSDAAVVARRGTDTDTEAVRAATREVLELPDPPTAIFAGHDDIAIEVLTALAEAGKRFGEISVVGYDDTDFAAHPLISMSSVDQRGAEMGEQAIGMLLERINGRREARQHVVTPTLRVRNSSGPPSSLQS